MFVLWNWQITKIVFLYHCPVSALRILTNSKNNLNIVITHFSVTWCLNVTVFEMSCVLASLCNFKWQYQILFKKTMINNLYTLIRRYQYNALIRYTIEMSFLGEQVNKLHWLLIAIALIVLKQIYKF